MDVKEEDNEGKYNERPYSKIRIKFEARYKAWIKASNNVSHLRLINI